MLRRLLLVSVVSLSAMFLLSSCGFVADGPFGWVYTDSKTPIAIGPSATGSKLGKACIHSFFGAIAVGDASIEAAMKEASITSIHTINKDNLSIFGTYTRQCTLITGE